MGRADRGVWATGDGARPARAGSGLLLYALVRARLDKGWLAVLHALAVESTWWAHLLGTALLDLISLSLLSR